MPAKLSHVFGLLFPILIILLSFGEACADPLVFTDVRAAQNLGFTTVDLFTHPAAVLESSHFAHPFENLLIFDVHLFGLLPTGTTNTLRFTLDRGEQGLEVFDQILPPGPNPCCPDDIFSHGFDFTDLPYRLPDGSAPPGATLFTLTIDIIGSSPDFVIPSGPNAGESVDSYTYSFYVVKPIPEPATMPLLVTGLAGIAARVGKRRKPV